MTPKHLLIEHMVVRWGDMDALGHVNNTQYFRYMEQARISWFDQLKISLAPGSDFGPVIVNASCNFFKPIVYPARIAISVAAGEPKRTSFPMFHRITSEDDPGLCYADGHTTVVWVDYRSGKSTPLPDWLRQLIT